MHAPQAGVWGLARAARAELVCTALACIDAGAASDPYGSSCTGSALLFSALLTHESELALDGGCGYVPRLCRAASSLYGPVQLAFTSRGAVSNLRVQPQLPLSCPSLVPFHLELRMHSVGLNFRDVLNILGEYPGDPGPLGGDGAGEVVGREVSCVRGFPVDSAVFGIAYAPLASLAHADARLMSRRAVALSHEQACTLPTTWSTVHTALGLVLPAVHYSLIVHAGAGGVGLVSVEYTHLLAMCSFATAGSPYKHSWLRREGMLRLSSSRNGLAFSASTTLHAGSRLQAVLNSLSTPP